MIASVGRRVNDSFVQREAGLRIASAGVKDSFVGGQLQGCLCIDFVVGQHLR
jgi:hypothetical protein